MGVRMFSKQNIDLIEQAIENEYKKMCSTYGAKYNTEHEGYAVLKEEIEEAEEEIKIINDFFSRLWINIKRNEHFVCELKGIKGRAQLLACEAFQVSAVCQKFLDTLQGGNKEND